MSKPEWGVKRTCHSCGTRFYDLVRSPIICPKCGSTFDPDLAYKPKRGSLAGKGAAAAAAAAEALPDLDLLPDDIVDDQDLSPDAGNDEDDEGGLIEDTSDLGEDDDDMTGVIDHLDENMGDEV